MPLFAIKKDSTVSKLLRPADATALYGLRLDGVNSGEIMISRVRGVGRGSPEQFVADVFAPDRRDLQRGVRSISVNIGQAPAESEREALEKASEIVEDYFKQPVQVFHSSKAARSAPLEERGEDMPGFGPVPPQFPGDFWRDQLFSGKLQNNDFKWAVRKESGPLARLGEPYMEEGLEDIKGLKVFDSPTAALKFLNENPDNIPSGLGVARIYFQRKTNGPLKITKQPRGSASNKNWFTFDSVTGKNVIPVLEGFNMTPSVQLKKKLTDKKPSGLFGSSAPHLIKLSKRRLPSSKSTFSELKRKSDALKKKSPMLKAKKG